MQSDNIDRLDLLFVVDDSAAMARPQRALREQFPQLLNTLSTGDRYPGDPSPFPPFQSIHLGVVSSDMGLSGVDAVPGCSADGGDDAILHDQPHGDACDAAYPRFLTYEAMLNTQRDKLASDLSCVANLGNAGCGVRQPLEAAFKALWPSVYTRGDGSIVDTNPFNFLASSPRGDMPIDQGGNRGFLRNDVASGQSLVAIVVLSDGDDCSLESPHDLADPSADDLAARCADRAESLYSIADRYRRGFQMLRPDRPDLVLFAAIVGVPADRVGSHVVENTDFSQAEMRDRLYDALLADPRMQIMRDAAHPNQLAASCEFMSSQGDTIRATPARRIVELAKTLGENSMVQSICQEDLGPAIDPIVDRIAPRSGVRCLSTPLRRNAEGRIECDLVWELPRAGSATSGVPTSCSELPFLKPLTGSNKTNAQGGQNCKVSQLSVTDFSVRTNPPAGAGWYYDDYSPEVQNGCRLGTGAQKISYSYEATIPTGVRAVLDCDADAPAR